MKHSAIVTAFLASCLFAIPAFAQPAGAPARAAAPAMVGQPVLGAAGPKASNRLANMGLDAGTAQKVQQVHRKYRAERQSIRQQVQTHRQQLVQLLRSNSNDQNAYRNAIQGLHNARKQMQTSKDRELAELQQVLTPKQQAQLMSAMKGRANKGKARGPRGQRGPKGKRGGRGSRNNPGSQRNR